ncbi:MAG: hypothetical protein Q4E65_08635 [Clostridia bacterium]|nr:hypothetical protein [Clostridia bacterium]
MKNRKLIALFLVLSLLLSCTAALANTAPEQAFRDALAKSQMVNDAGRAHLSATLESLLATADTWKIEVSAANRALMKKVIDALKGEGAAFADLTEEEQASFVTFVDDLRDEVLRRMMQDSGLASVMESTNGGDLLDGEPDRPGLID